MPDITAFPIPTITVDLEAAVGYELDAGGQSGAYQWDLTAPQLRLTLTGDTTLTATGISNGRNARVVAVQDATGGHSLTFGSGFATAGGNQPAIATAPGAMTAFQGFTSGGAVILDLRGEIDTSPSVTVQTNSASDINAGAATINGTLLTLVNADSADVYFEYREVGAASWIETAAQTLTANGQFTQALTGLNEVEHEYRAIAVSGSANTQGDTLTFDPVFTQGSVYTEDFQSLTTGATTVPGFTQPWAPVTLSVVDLGGDKALRVRATTDATRCALQHTAASNDADRVNSRIFVQAITGAGDAPVRILSRIAGAVGYTTAVSSGRAGSTGIRIDQYLNGAFSTLQTATFNSASTRLNLLMETVGSTVTLKAWQDGTAEPATPQVTATTTVTEAGGLGLFFFNVAAIDITYLSIATGDRIPERPL